ncbi:xanthine permease [Glaciecola sp. XM2]|nr:xanthine permease [Glaciecola sp. XM2]
MRIPFVHMRFSLPDMLQGFAVAGATGLALVPYFMALLGLSFEEAVVMAMFHSLLISFSWMLFGDPYAPGWLTPAIPFVVAFITAPAYLGDHASQFQAMTALSLNFAAVLVFLGVTGLGAKLIQIVPNVFKGGIILGAAIAAFMRVTKDGDAANVFQSAPIAGTIGVVVCLLFAFSKPLQAIALRNQVLAKILGFGLLPGFIIAGTVGYFTGEFEYNIRWEILNVGDAAVSLWAKASPFMIGWPPIETFIASFPLALITYILFFGDVVTGNEMIEHAQKARTDEKLEINSSRAHMATGIRNALMGIIAPFFSTQGVLWTGIQVILLKRWADSKGKLNSIFDSIGSFYLFGLPILFVLLPLVTLLEPLLPVALAVTLILTAFACATLALSLVDDATERGAMVITAMAFSLFEPWLGLLIGIITIAGLCGIRVFMPKARETNQTE